MLSWIRPSLLPAPVRKVLSGFVLEDVISRSVGGKPKLVSSSSRACKEPLVGAAAASRRSCFGEKLKNNDACSSCTSHYPLGSYSLPYLQIGRSTHASPLSASTASFTAVVSRITVSSQKCPLGYTEPGFSSDNESCNHVHDYALQTPVMLSRVASNTDAVVKGRPGLSIDKQCQVEHELRAIGELPPRQLRFTELFQIRDPLQAATLLHSELSKRYAKRVRQLDGLEMVAPNCFVKCPHLKEVREIYVSCFKELRWLSLQRIAYFNCVVRSMKRRHERVVSSLVVGMRELKKLVEGKEKIQSFEARGSRQSNVDQWIDSFLYQFFLNRVSTELLREQYVAAVDSGCPSGIAVTSCKPAVIIQRAVQSAVGLCMYHLGIVPKVFIDVNPKADGSLTKTDAAEACATARTRLEETPSLLSLAQRDHHRGNKGIAVGCKGRHDLTNTISYVPAYIHSAAFELLKNALRASVENHIAKHGRDENSDAAVERAAPPPVHVVITPKTKELLVEVKDQGGGITPSELPKVWSFSYTTAELPDRTVSVRSGVPPPLAGCGVGLPLSRLYINYLGGDIWLNSTPGVGTSAFLYLRNLTDDWTEASTKAMSSTVLLAMRTDKCMPPL